VIERRQKIDPVGANELDDAMFLCEMSRACASEFMLQRFRLADAG
jgi:hypothetical protein